MSTRTPQVVMGSTEVNRVLGGRILYWFSRRPLLVDALVATASFLVQAFVVLIARPDSAWGALLIAGTSSAVLLWRRRMPIFVLVTVAVIGTISALLPALTTSVVLPAAIVVYTVASIKPLGPALLGYLLAVGVPANAELLQQLIAPDTHAPTLLDPLALLALALGIAARSATQRREALTELMNERLATARFLEQQRITAEMHDVVAHSLSTMIALADGASTGWQKYPERSARALGKLGDVGRSALTDMRRILNLLREDDQVLAENLHRSGHNVPNLDELVDVFRHAGMPVRLTRSGAALPHDAALVTTIYRIVQEALTNALRYATGASQVEVSVDVTNTAVTIRVTDDGRAGPHAVSQGSGHGLVGIAKRAAAYDGTSSSGPINGGGWETRTTLALENKDQ